MFISNEGLPRIFSQTPAYKGTLYILYKLCDF